jgi:hypothetical protein
MFHIERAPKSSCIVQEKFGITKSAFPRAAQDMLRELLPVGAELMVQEEQETDYENIIDDLTGLEIYLPISSCDEDDSF